MSQPTPRALANPSAVRLDALPRGEFHWLRSTILEQVAGGAHLCSLFPLTLDGETLLVALLNNHEARAVIAAAAPIGAAYPALTPECPEAHLFEREIFETWGITPQGHPWLKPVRFLPGREASAAGPSVMDFFRVDGEEVHEVAVGPVHAGVIEPGHFRFQCHGEKVMHLEISLGYQHRGIEAALAGGPDIRTRHLLETAAGDTTCGHGLAHAMLMEGFADHDVPAAAHRVRAIGLELERIANHVGDLGALAGDVGFLPTASFCGRLRGDILNLTALICGNRFGRGLIVPGGVRYGIDAATAATARERLAAAMRDIGGAVDLLFRRPSVNARFEGTGSVERITADRLGMVGPAARASGLEADVRVDLPHGVYAEREFPLRLGEAGDVLARARQRWVEVQDSAELIDALLREDCAAPAPTAVPPPAPDSLAVALTEGWRGQICHAAVTDAAGRFRVYTITDPSFHNWPGLAMALRGAQISDFPLCNKSFNLSYCGQDL
ncbi:MAG: NADH-quinone oxidoreductase subunit C [Planctomycetaceae bacterium]|nr:NADH-quinone oxidoreductase subunit C [Planctomycetaceae bacterium]